MRYDYDGNIILTQREYDYLLDMAYRYYSLREDMESQKQFPDWDLLSDEYDEYGNVVDKAKKVW
jgi:hypothetical protein